MIQRLLLRGRGRSVSHILDIELSNVDMHMQYCYNIYSEKKDNFRMNFFFIFCYFAQNRDCGYMIKLPH